MDGLDYRRDQRFALVEVDDLLSDLGDVWDKVMSHSKNNGNESKRTCTSDAEFLVNLEIWSGSTPCRQAVLLEKNKNQHYEELKVGK